MWDMARHHCKEGWPSDSENIAKHPLIARRGWFSDESKKENHPGCVCFGGFAKFSLMTQPPLLAVVPCHVPHLFAGHGGIEDNWRGLRLSRRLFQTPVSSGRLIPYLPKFIGAVVSGEEEPNRRTNHQGR